MQDSPMWQAVRKGSFLYSFHSLLFQVQRKEKYEGKTILINGDIIVSSLYAIFQLEEYAVVPHM